MSSPRIAFAMRQGLHLPDGPLLAVGPAPTPDMQLLPPDRTRVVQRYQPDAERLTRLGYDVRPEPGDWTGAEAAIVTLPRARDAALNDIARACAACDGTIIVDGAKTDGVDSVLKALRARVEIVGSFSKAHGKVSWFQSTDLSDWIADPAPIEGGWITAPGVFSADGPDAASVLLADALPTKLGAMAADLGSGWGYLAKRAWDAAQDWHLIDADAVALECARQNAPGATYHWADATAWDTRAAMDAVIMNPPFHIGRKGDPSLGQAFIDTAARVLKPSGALWMVANRHLPYETTLDARFRRVEEVAGTAGFKVLHASHPKRERR